MAEDDKPKREEFSPPEGVALRGKLFVSRAGADRKLARQLIDDLVGLGYKVWAQDYGIGVGANFLLYMDDALRDADATIALLSDNYLGSRYCRLEAISAYDSERLKLIPLLIKEGCTPDGLIKGFVFLDVAARLATEPAEVVKLVDRVFREGKPLDAYPPETQFLQRSRFFSSFPLDDRALFVGREDAMQAVEAGLARGPVAITGMGGTGKSWLARLFATRSRLRYRGVWSVRAENETDLIEDLAKLGAEIDPALAAIADRREAARQTRDRLTAETGRPYLLIFDNAETPDVLHAWAPQGRSHVIATSRWADWSGAGVETVALDGLPRAEAVALLRALSPRTPEAHAGEIADRLDRLPLALMHAGAVLRRADDITPAEYLSDLGKRLASPPPRGSHYTGTVAASLGSNLDQLAREHPHAPALLDLAAFCAADEIPVELWSTPSALEALPAELSDPVELKTAIGALEAFSLARIDRDNRLGRTLSVHRLVQAVIRDRLAAEGRADRARRAVLGAFNTLYPVDGDDVRLWPQCARLHPHVEAALALTPDDAMTIADSELCGISCTYLTARALFPAAETMSRRSLVTGRKLLPSGDSRIATRLNNLANLLQERNAHAEAIGVLREALAIYQAIDPHHPRIATTLNNLAQALERDPKTQDEAEKLMELVLKMDEARRGETHADVARDLINLGCLLARTGRAARAERLHHRAVRIAESDPEAYGVTLGRYLVTYCGTLGWLDRYAETEPLLKRALDIYDRMHLGRDHPHRAVALNNYGSALRARGAYEQAAEAIAEAARILTAIYGDNSADLAGTLGNLAGALQQSGRPAESLPHRKRAWDIMRNLHGETHPRSELTRDNYYMTVVMLHDLGKLPPDLEALALQLKAHLGRGPVRH